MILFLKFIVRKYAIVVKLYGECFSLFSINGLLDYSL